jgi:WD40-like Beta Propeller Repeat
MTVRGLMAGCVVAVCVSIGGLVCASVPALAVEAPRVEETFSTNVASSSATLHAVVNPGGEETSYVFEYAPAGGGFSPVGGSQGSGTLSEGASGVPVEVHVQEGLAPGASYEFRVTVGNAAQRGVVGEVVSFTTEQTGGGFALPDGRAWEMVTPPQKDGALFRPQAQASVAGDAVAELENQPSEAEPQGNAEPGVSVLSTRGSGGWSSTVIAVPHPVAGPVTTVTTEYPLFSEDLSRAIVESIGPAFERLSPLASEPTPYLRTLYTGGDVAARCEGDYRTAASCFAPLVSLADDTASPFQPFGGLLASGGCEAPVYLCGPLLVDGTPDLSHVVVESRVPLTATPIEPESGEVNPSLYEFAEGQLQLVSLMPGSVVGSGRFILAGSYGPGVGFRHTMSDDGQRVIMEAFPPGKVPGSGIPLRSGLYLHDLARGGETVRLDEPEAQCVSGGVCTESVDPEFMAANGEGSRVLFLDSGRLTANAGAASVSRGGGEPNKLIPDLYECAISQEPGTGRDRCALTDLTPLAGGESAGVDMVLGASEDGSYVYFVAGGGLGVAQPGACQHAAFEPGPDESEVPVGALCNVYVRHGGVTRLVARLSQQDIGDWGHLGSSRVSPDGRWLAFLSVRGLTGYDTRSANGAGAVGELYLYGADSGAVACVSCEPTGARPLAGASVPDWTRVGGATAFVAFYQPRYLLDSGRVFFDSSDALVPGDVSGQSEVYEYEPEGVGGCTSSSASGGVVFRPARGFDVEGQGVEGGGCVALVSSGTAAEGSRFLDASPSGGDVFFLTAARLLPQDVDSAPDVYDAHECTGESPCIAPPASQSAACDSEAACKAPPSSQPSIYGVPASVTFAGPGNLLPPPLARVVKPRSKAKCARGRVRDRRGQCVRVHRRAKKPVKSNRKGRR